MLSSIQNIKKARELRLFGKSLSEISYEMNISKSTLSFWLKDIVLNEKQKTDLKNRINSKMNRGRLNASIILKSKRIFNEKKIFDESNKQFPILSKDHFFIHGLSLYWAKGTGKGNCFQFTSSNQMMISIMLKWIKKYLKVEDNFIKNKKYGNYSRIYIYGINNLRKVIAWQKLLIGYYNSVL